MLAVAGCVVSGSGFGAVFVVFVEVLGVGMVLVGRCGAGVAQLVWRLRHVDLGDALGAHLDHCLRCEAVSSP